MADIIQPRKLCEVKQIVEENDLEVQGDKSLLDIPRVEHFPQHHVDLWRKELQQIYPEMPDELLAQVLDLYNTNPDIFNDLCDDAKANPTKYKAKEQEALKFPEGSNTVEITNAK